jgi:hypothetical protein
MVLYSTSMPVLKNEDSLDYRKGPLATFFMRAYPLVQPHTQGIDLHHGVVMISRAYVSV